MTVPKCFDARTGWNAVFSNTCSMEWVHMGGAEVPLKLMSILCRPLAAAISNRTASVEVVRMV